MSDNYDDDLTNDETVDDDPDSPKSLRRAASKSRKLEAELNSLKRELAFSKAGIPMNDPRITYFVKGYEGELDPNAIRAAAVEAGFIQSSPQQQDAQQQVGAAEQRVMSASAGAVVEDASEAAALARLETAMNEGGVEAMLGVARQYGIPTYTES